MALRLNTIQQQLKTEVSKQMTVKIRLQRRGRAKKPVYRIVIQDSRTARDGKVIDIIGQYNPLSEPMLLEVVEEKVKKWLSEGAQPTETVERLLAIKGLVTVKKPHKKAEIATKEEVLVEADVVADEAPAVKKKTTKKAEAEA